MLGLLYAAVIVLFVVLFYGTYRYILDLRYRLPPGPIPVPFIGAAYYLSDNQKKPWKEFAKLADVYGKIYTFYFGSLRVILLSDPEMIRNILVKNAKTYSYRAEAFIPGYQTYSHGVISSSGDRWNLLRKFCTRAIRELGSGGQTSMASRVQDEAYYLVQEVDSRVGKAGTINKLIVNAVSNVTCSIVFGKRFAYDDQAFLKLLKITANFFERPYHENAKYVGVPVLTKFILPPQVRDLIDVTTGLEEILRSTIDERKRHPSSGEKIRDFIDLYLLVSQSEEELSFDAFLGTIRDMFLAGTETTSTALLWTFLYFCKWPHYQKRCQQEIDQVIGTDRLPTVSDRPNLIYVEAVMCEILRHVTIVPNALWHATTDEMNEFGGYTIPPNTVINYNVWAVHHDPEYWNDPEQFRPERWIDENDGSLLAHASHFMPFGVGPRICLGEQLARLEYFIFIVALLHRFNFAFPDGYDVDLESGRHSITNVPPDFNVVVTKRH